MLTLHPSYEPQDLLVTPMHLAPGSRVQAVHGFAWRPDVLAAYTSATEADGVDGRLLVVIEDEGPGDHWERHLADEVVVCLVGRVVVRRSSDPSDHSAEEVTLGPGEAVVNPAGMWHAVDMDGPARVLTITPGPGSEHLPRG